MQVNMEWSEYFFRHVYLAAQKSKDDRTRIGAVLVRADSRAIISEGFNGICRNVIDPADEDNDKRINIGFPFPRNFKKLDEKLKSISSRNQKPTKYFFYEHAERNSIYNCARHGISTLNSICYTQGIPCADCARGLIQAGITKIVVHKQWPNLTHSQAWVESIGFSKEMLNESGVEIEIYDKILNIEGFLDGKVIKV